MTYLVLARKYRPINFEEVLAQEHITQTLKNAIISNRIAHAILFAGPRGTGKTTIARVLSKALNCIVEGVSITPCGKCEACLQIAEGDYPDVIEIDGASNNSVDQIRRLNENIIYTPIKSPYKIYIIDEVHMLSISAFNALLKTLEEPPPHIKFFFATTEINKLPITILSRCQRYDLRRIDAESIFKHLKQICKKENFKIEEEGLHIIAKEADGSIRDSLSILDQIASSKQDTISYNDVLLSLGATDKKIVFDMSNAVFKSDISKILEIIDNAYYHGKNLKNLYKSFLEHIRNLLIIKLTGEKSSAILDLSKSELDLYTKIVLNLSDIYLRQILDILFKEESQIKFSMHEKFALELLFIKIAQVAPSISIDKLIEKIDSLQEIIKKNTHTTQELTKKEPVNIYQEKIEDKIKENAEPVVNEKVSCEITENALNKKKIQIKDKDEFWLEFLKFIEKKETYGIHSSLSKSYVESIENNIVKIVLKGKKFNIHRIKNKLENINEMLSTFLKVDMKIKIEKEIEEKVNQERIQEDYFLQSNTLKNPFVQKIKRIFNAEVMII